MKINSTCFLAMQLYLKLLSKRYPFLRVLSFFIILFFTNQTVSAQEVLPVDIFLSNDAFIYSADENFNNQIAENKINFKNSKKKSVELSKRNEILVVTVQKQEGKEKYAELIKSRLNKSIEADFKEIKEKIKLVEENKKHYDPIKLKSFPSHNLFSDTDSFQVSATSVSNSNFLSKECIRKDIAVFFGLLSLKDFQEYVHYNNKSLDFCFSKVFSVRPPPQNFS